MRNTLLFFFMYLSVSTMFPLNSFRIIGYLPTYRWSSIPNLDFEKVTHVNLSFANPDECGDLIYGRNIPDVLTKAHGKGAKVFMSIGGANPGAAVKENYTNLFKPANRSVFIQKILNYVVDNELDGIDVDLEGDFLQIPFFNEFVSELSIKLRQNNKEISAAVARWSGARYNNQALAALDWINLMSYDATGPWTPGNPGQHSPMSRVVDDYTYWNTTRSVSNNKITIGVPFYGYEFVNATTVKTLTYREIITQYPGAENTDVINGNLFYNGIPTIMQKTEYAFMNAKGIMFWEWGQDATDTSKSLLNAIHTKLNNLTSNTNIEIQPVNIYRDHVSKKILISLKESGDYLIDIYSITGVRVFSGNYQYSTEIKTNDWEKGIYLLRYKIGRYAKIVKLIIE